MHAAMFPSPQLLGGVKELVKLDETVVFGCCSDAHCFRGWEVQVIVQWSDGAKQPWGRLDRARAKATLTATATSF